MGAGVPILGTVTKKCKVKKEAPFVFRITLVQGLNRQIRRMCEHFGYEVTKLERTRIMNVSLTGIPLGEWRDLTDDELIDLFKLIENSSSEAKPKARPKAKAATPGIKRPVVKMENSNDKGRPAGNGKRFTQPGRKRKGVNACRGSAYSPTRKRSLPYPFYKPAVFSPGGLSSLPLHAAPSAYRYIPFHAVRFRIAQRAAMRNTRAVKQRFQFALFALGHLFLCNTGECHGGALSQTRAPSVRQ